MLLLDQLAEEKIQRAIDEGQLANLPHQGKPIELEDLCWLPEDLRAAYLILKNSGFLPSHLIHRCVEITPNSLVTQLYTHYLKHSKP